MITYKLYTDKGNRNNNEDSVGEWDENGRYLFVLADGLGGHGKGEVASAIAVETAITTFVENKESNSLETCFEMTQKNVLDKQAAEPVLGDMKTTMVALAIENGKAKWAHIGDSRLYHFNKNKIVKRTLDHSVPQMLVNSGEIKEKEIRGHEDRNRLLRVIGSEWERKSYDVSPEISLNKCQAFLLCSDGFWEYIDEKTMKKLLKKSSSADEWLELMVAEVKRNGAGKDMDNNSAIVVWTE